LAKDEGLKWVKEVFDSEAGQEAMHTAVGRAQEIIETGVEP
jgi:hypothetical protein